MLKASEVQAAVSFCSTCLHYSNTPTLCTITTGRVGLPASNSCTVLQELHQLKSEWEGGLFHDDRGAAVDQEVEQLVH